MSKYLAVFTSSCALAAIAAPVAAQDVQMDDRYQVVTSQVADDWQGEAQAGASYTTVTEAPYDQVDFEYDSVPIGDGATLPPDAYEYETVVTESTYPAATPRFAYSDLERQEWLSQCRALRASHDRPRYYVEEDDTDGGLLGGLLGAIAGGVVGNRVADGDRLLGTVIGAGLGGLAGAVIGSAIDGDDDEDYVVIDDGYAFDYCEAYLLNYERGYGYPGHATTATVIAVPAAQHGMRTPQRHQRRVISRIIETDVPIELEEAPAPAPAPVIRNTPPVGKTQAIK